MFNGLASFEDEYSATVLEDSRRPKYGTGFDITEL